VANKRCGMSYKIQGFLGIHGDGHPHGYKPKAKVISHFSQVAESLRRIQGIISQCLDPHKERPSRGMAQVALLSG